MTKTIFAAAAAVAALLGAASAEPAATPTHAKPNAAVYEIVVVARTGNEFAARRLAASPMRLAAMDARLNTALVAGMHARVAAAIDSSLSAPALPFTVASL